MVQRARQDRKIEVCCSRGNGWMDVMEKQKWWGNSTPQRAETWQCVTPPGLSPFWREQEWRQDKEETGALDEWLADWDVPRERRQRHWEQSALTGVLNTYSLPDRLFPLTATFRKIKLLINELFIWAGIVHCCSMQTTSIFSALTKHTGTYRKGHKSIKRGLSEQKGEKTEARL